MLLRIEKQWFLDLDRLMPLLIQVIKWCILNFEELYCLPGLQQNFGICWKGVVLRQTGASCDLLESHSLFGWVTCFWRFPLTACFGLFPISQEKVLHFGPNTEVTSGWGMDETDPLSSVWCCFPLPSRAKWASALEGNIFSFLHLATKTIVSSGNSNNYFTSYSWVLVTVFIP